MTSRASGKGGFTLLELLVVIVISSLIVLTVTLVFRSIIQNTKKAAVKIENRLYKSGRNRVIWKQIASQIPYKNSIDESSFVYGSSDSLLLVSPFSLTGNYRKGLIIAYYIVQLDLKKKYTLHCWELPIKDDEFSSDLAQELTALREKRVFNLLAFIHRQQDKEEISLFENARKISFEFLYPETESKKKIVWKKQWQKDLPPKAIRINIINSKEETEKITVPLLLPDTS